MILKRFSFEFLFVQFFKVGFLFASLLLASCAQKPTKVFEKKPRTPKISIVRPSLDKPIQLTEKTIVLDVRDAFNYSMAHVRESININWKDFSQRKAPFQGLLQPDLFFHARRLARAGIGPNSDVLVLDKGLSGGGEAGRVAWTLFYMGVKNVRYASIEMFRHGWTNHVTEKKARGVSIWKPKRQSSIWLKKPEMMKVLTGSSVGYYKRSAAKKRKAGGDTVIVDVRSLKEFAAQEPDIGAIHIPWTEFFDKNGRPLVEMEQKLQAVGIRKNQRIILISNRGVRSAAATMALLDLGFVKSTNYAGGFMELRD